MNFKLTVYTDDTLKEVARIAEADELKIPYRVAMYIGQHLDKLNLKDTDSIYDFVMKNLDKVDRIIKATFGVTDDELEFVDIMELGKIAVELYKWGAGKMKGLNEGATDEKNEVATGTSL